MTETNIKNLPIGETNKYFTEIGYSQSYPWKEIKRTACTRTLARVEVTKDPEWIEKMDFHAGGFCGHVSNQHAQTWLYDCIIAERTVTIRLTKRGEWGRKGVRFIEDRANHFYDYNF